MNLSHFFIHRPVATTLLALGVIIFGIVAFLNLPVAPLPQIEFPTISISAALPGASPETMATSVATPLERQLGQIAGVTEITSTSKLGSMRIVVQFDLNRDINGAARDVQAAIMVASANLPSTLPSQPTYRLINPADAPIMVIGLTSKSFTSGQMYDLASTILQQKLSQIEGVGQVIVGGSSLPAVRIELNPYILNHYGIGFEDIRQAIQKTNVNQPKGFISNATHTWEIKTNDQLFGAEHYQPLIVSYKNNAPIRLRDVGEVIDSVEDIRNIGVTDGNPSVVLIVFKQPGTNIIETIDRIHKALDKMKANIPAAINLVIPMDRTETIKKSLSEVEKTLLLSILFVVGVMYAFLKSLRAALIPSIVIPITILGTFGIMYLCGFSLDNLSLMALTISTGFIVDDAVVVLENIQRRLEKGMAPLKAALEGAKEVGFTVLSMSTSLIAVFLPILLMGGIIGRLFREFSLTLSISILVSLVISLTLTPLMSSRILKPSFHKVPSSSPSMGRKIQKFYRKTLKWALNHQNFILSLTGVTIILNVFLFILVPKGFFPLQDTGRIVGSIQTQQDMSFQELEKKVYAFMEIIQQDPAIQHVAGFAGGANAIGSSGSLFIALKPRHERDATAFEVIERLRRKFSRISGANLFMQASQDIVIGGRQGNALFQYTLFGSDLDALNEWVPLVQEKLSHIPGIVDLNTDQLNHGLDVYLTYNRDILSRYGVTSQQVDQALYDAFGQSQISTMYTSMNQYHVVMELAPKYCSFPDILNYFFVTNTSGNKILLSNLALFKPSSTLLTVNHQSQLPAATLSFNLAPGFSLGDVVSSVTKTVDSLKLPITKIQGDFGQTALAFKTTLASEPYLILTAIIVIYIVLGILYESMIHPLTILSTLPSAGVGALLALIIAGSELSIMGLIGILLLIGIVKKNAIMLVDFAIDIQRRRHKKSHIAIYQACLLRARPIMMTTLAALLGAVPLILTGDVGSELRRPLGISIVGGLVISQILTLYTTPVIYLKLEALSQFLKYKLKHMGLKNQPNLVLKGGDND